METSTPTTKSYRRAGNAKASSSSNQGDSMHAASRFGTTAKSHLECYVRNLERSIVVTVIGRQRQSLRN